jgi:hypothetical protein
LKIPFYTCSAPEIFCPGRTCPNPECHPL